MDGETVYEALWELKCNGPHKWDALQLLESEVLTATMLRPSEKIAMLKCLRNLPEELPPIRQRLIGIVERRLKRTVVYQAYLVTLVTALLIR